MKGTKMISLIVAMATIMIAGVNAVWICPSDQMIPRQADVHHTSSAPLPTCVEAPSRSGSLSFFVHVDESLFSELIAQNNKKSPVAELVQIFPLPFFPNYVVMVADESALPTLDLLMAQNERQLISGPKKQTKKAAPVIPRFQKMALKDDIVESMSGDDYYSEMEKITGEKPFNLGGKDITITTRYTHTQNNIDVAAYYLQRLKALGFDASYQEFRYASQTTRNIIGIKRGTTLAGEVVVVGAHMDSTSPSPQSSAPGCVDNGSGAEGVMLMAKAFANSTSQRTIHFILWGAEEQGLIGSNYYVDQLGQTGYNVAYSLIMDMIGYSNRYYGVKVETSSSSANTALGNLFVDNLDTYASDLTVLRSTNYFGSDHVPFIDADIPCFLAIEQDDVDYVGYHRTTDRVNYLSVGQSMGILRGLAGTLYDLAY